MAVQSASARFSDCRCLSMTRRASQPLRLRPITQSGCRRLALRREAGDIRRYQTSPQTRSAAGRIMPRENTLLTHERHHDFGGRATFLLAMVCSVQ